MVVLSVEGPFNVLDSVNEGKVHGIETYVRNCEGEQMEEGIE